MKQISSMMHEYLLIDILISTGCLPCLKCLPIWWAENDTSVILIHVLSPLMGFQVVLVVRNLPASAGDIRDMGSIPGLGRSPGGGDGNLLQYSCLENPMDRGVWWAAVHRVAKSQTWLRWFSTHTTNEAYSLHRFTDDFHFQFTSFAYLYTVLLYFSFIICKISWYIKH